MLQYLHETLGIEASFIPFNQMANLPFYLTQTYRFSILKMMDKEFIYLELIDKLPTASSIKKHMDIIYNKYNKPCILGLHKILSYQRKNLIEKRIPFIVPNGQLFVPSLGISLTEKISKTTVSKSSELFTRTTQILFLYLLYDENFRVINSTDAAYKLNCSKMTMVRAFDQLQVLGLVTAKAEGTKKLFSVTVAPKELFDKCKKYLRSPITKVIYTDNYELLQNTPISGLEALSRKTMLNPPQHHIRAIFKDDIRLKEINIYNVDYLDHSNAYELELWDYDPNIFSKAGLVDTISLFTALQNSKDERIQIELSKLMEDYLW